MGQLLRLHRAFATEQEKNEHNRRLDRQIYGHCSPNSVFVACMGPNWEQGCREAVEAMVNYAIAEKGANAAICEIPDLCYTWGDAIGTMRNMAYTEAIREGFEWILYLDNDVKPPKDSLVKMLGHDILAIVASRLRYWDGNDYGMDVAKIAENSGLARVISCPLSFVLFRTAVFVPWYPAGNFWADAIGADEAFHFGKLATIGHMPVIDTSVTVEVVKPPHFPLDDRPSRREPRGVALSASKLTIVKGMAIR